MNDEVKKMVDMNYLRPDEARQVFDDWMKKEAEHFSNTENARFQIFFDIVGGKIVFKGLIL